jgi:type IV secretory pathway VirB10-like protein
MEDVGETSGSCTLANSIRELIKDADTQPEQPRQIQHAQPIQLAQPQPLRPAQPLPVVLQTPSMTPQQQQQQQQQQQVFSAEDRDVMEVSRQKRRRTDSEARTEASDESFRKRYDSIWGRRGHDDRKGSGAGGGVN